MNEEPELIIRLRDVRTANLCSSGARAWFAKYDLDWMDFLKNGIPASKMLATGDAMGAKLVEHARRTNGQQ